MNTNAQHSQNFQLAEKNLEFNRFGIIAIMLLIVGCLGGIAVGLGAIEHVVTLTAVVIPTMVTLSMIIAVAPMKLTLFSAIAASSIDIVMILFFALN